MTPPTQALNTMPSTNRTNITSFRPSLARTADSVQHEVEIPTAKREAYQARCDALNSRFGLNLAWQQFARAEIILHALCEPDDLLALEEVAEELQDSPVEWDYLLVNLAEELCRHYDKVLGPAA